MRDYSSQAMAEDAVRGLIEQMWKEKNNQGFTWESLGREAEMSAQSIQHWTQERFSPSMIKFCQVLDALGLELTIRRKEYDAGRAV